MKHEIVLLRRKHALTQLELANLIGVSQTTVTRLEAENACNIRLEWALALQVVFGIHPGRLFKHLYEEIEDAVIRRSSDMERGLDGKQDHDANYKRALLAEMVRRASSGSRA